MGDRASWSQIVIRETHLQDRQAGHPRTLPKQEQNDLRIEGVASPHVNPTCGLPRIKGKGQTEASGDWEGNGGERRGVSSCNRCYTASIAFFGPDIYVVDVGSSASAGIAVVRTRMSGSNNGN